MPFSKEYLFSGPVQGAIPLAYSDLSDNRGIRPRVVRRGDAMLTAAGYAVAAREAGSR